MRIMHVLWDLDYIYFSHAKAVGKLYKLQHSSSPIFFSWHDTKALWFLVYYAKKSNSKNLDKDPTATYFLAD